MRTTAIERVLRHDHALVIGGLLIVVALCWTYLFIGAGVMGVMGEMDDASMAMAMLPQPWAPGHALLMLLMWVVMMAAMMLPGAAPMLLLFATITSRRRAEKRRSLALGAFALGYVVTWAAFSLAAVTLQFALENAALLSPMLLRTTHVALAGAVLIAAGVYQWTPLKHACLRHCHSPLDFVLTHWREGTRGAFEMGLRHGVYCVGCCWALMLLLFVVGVMNLVWIAGLAIFVLLEKLLPAGHWLGRVAGVALMVWGIAVLVTAIPF